MPSTYTTSGIELIADGEKSNTWGPATNNNLKLLDQLVSQAVSISLSGTTHTVTISDGFNASSEGQYGVLLFAGSPTGTNTVTISPNDGKRIFIVKNDSGESVVLTQGSGGNVTVADGKTAIVYCDGAGSGAKVVNLTVTLDVALTTLGITATASELNTLDGITATTGELNTLDGITSTTGELNLLDGKTAQDFFPSGGIILWSGSIANIPSGWFLCDGTNGTPDLRDRFVVGAGDSYAVDATGGASSVTLGISQIPGHTHTFSGTTSVAGTHNHSPGSGGNFLVTGTGSGPGWSGTGGSYAPTDTPSATSSAGGHSHTFSGTTSSTGSGSSHENRPPYYALAYIMRA